MNLTDLEQLEKTADYVHGLLIGREEALRLISLAKWALEARDALKEILEAGQVEELDDKGECRPWDAYLLYHKDVSRYWDVLYKFPKEEE